MPADQKFFVVQWMTTITKPFATVKKATLDMVDSTDMGKGFLGSGVSNVYFGTKTCPLYLKAPFAFGREMKMLLHRIRAGLIDCTTCVLLILG